MMDIYENLFWGWQVLAAALIIINLISMKLSFRLGSLSTAENSVYFKLMKITSVLAWLGAGLLVFSMPFSGYVAATTFFIVVVTGYLLSILSVSIIEGPIYLALPASTIINGHLGGIIAVSLLILVQLGLSQTIF